MLALAAVPVWLYAAGAVPLATGKGPLPTLVTAPPAKAVRVRPDSSPYAELEPEMDVAPA